MSKIDCRIYHRIKSQKELQLLISNFRSVSLSYFKPFMTVLPYHFVIKFHKTAVVYKDNVNVFARNSKLNQVILFVYESLFTSGS